jgi:EPS-associated MarR family transcriptional regulator
LGKVNYLIKALTEKGIIKLKSFKSSRKKAGYLYYLTPKGIKKKAEITRKFLEQRLEEYDKLQEEIRCLKCDWRLLVRVKIEMYNMEFSKN